MSEISCCLALFRAMKAVDVATSRVKRWQPEAHAAAINALLPVADNLVASGDDEGCIKLWDPRQASEASASFSEHTDFIADFAYQVCSHSASLHLCIAHILRSRLIAWLPLAENLVTLRGQ